MIALLACLLLGVISVDIPVDAPCYLHVTLPDGIDFAVQGMEPVVVNASAGLVTKHYRMLGSPATLLIDDGGDPMSVPAPDISTDPLEDCNLNGSVEMDDVIYVRDRLGTNDPRADVNLDGIVDIADLIQVRNAL